MSQDLAPERSTGIRFVDWDTGQTFQGELVPDPLNVLEQILKIFQEGKSGDGLVVDRLNTGAIAILEASGDEMLALQKAEYRLSID